MLAAEASLAGGTINGYVTADSTRLLGSIENFKNNKIKNKKIKQTVRNFRDCMMGMGIELNIASAPYKY